jgi:hypothetical protein
MIIPPDDTSIVQNYLAIAVDIFGAPDVELSRASVFRFGPVRVNYETGHWDDFETGYGGHIEVLSEIKEEIRKKNANGDGRRILEQFIAEAKAYDGRGVETADTEEDEWVETERASVGGKKIGTGFATAVREAVETDRMLDAALIYAKHGIPIFPVDHRNKRPIPKRDPDPTGKHPRGIPRTGGFYKATCDPIIITRWWKGNPRALIAMPTGSRSGVWVIDVDTAEEHGISSVDAWEALLEQHEPFDTREHRSSSGGPHVFFTWREDQPLGCSSGELPKGISTKGEGGYVLMPPSVRKGRPYVVYRDIDPVDAPQWLIDKILNEGEDKPKRGPKIPHPRQPFEGAPQVDLDELASAMRFVPNDDLGWEKWTSWALAIFAASGGALRGFDIFDEFSARSSKYDAVTTDERWFEISGSPPDRTGAGKIYKAAREHGWLPKLKAAPPTYAIAAGEAAEGRNRMREVVRGFLFAVDNPDPWQKYSNEPPPPIAQAACIDVGIGKTQITIEELARWLKNRTTEPSGPLVYATPRHNLNKRIEQQFAEHGINARIYRGREADDPQQSGKKMCLNLAAVELAKKCHAEIATTCLQAQKATMSVVRSLRLPAPAARPRGRAGLDRRHRYAIPPPESTGRADRRHHRRSAVAEGCARRRGERGGLVGRNRQHLQRAAAAENVGERQRLRPARA